MPKSFAIMLRPMTLAVFLLCAIGSAGCSKQNATKVVETKTVADACTLLTGDDLKAVQGEEPVQASPSGAAQRGFTVRQCYFSMPTSENSVVLTVTSGASNDIDQYWKRTFHENADKGRDKEEKEVKGGEEGEREATGPERVGGLGDEAFWSASRFGGALYVLKANIYLRISVGGKDDEQTKLTKSKQLAERALKRLSQLP
jgi:hypothetical protein